MEAKWMERTKRMVLVAALAAGGALAADPAPGEELSTAERAKIEKRMGELSKEMRELGRKLGEERRMQMVEINRGALNRAMLGINVDDEESTTKGDGVHVAAVTPRGPAAEAGLRAGDVLTTFDGKPLKRDGDATPYQRLRELMEDRKPGDEVKLKVLRDGKTTDATVKVESYAPRAFAYSFGLPGGPEQLAELEMLVPRGPMPPMPPMGPIGPGMERFRWYTREWGDLEMVSLSPKLGEYFGAKDGVLVVHAPDGGTIKLQDGDVITKVGERKPANPEQVLRILRSYEPGESLKLEVLRNRKPVTLEVKVPERGGARGGDDPMDIIIRP
jgi:membrane-associated protease RseP (regulator of RpoE activity)